MSPETRTALDAHPADADAVIETMANHRRRGLLRYLLARDADAATYGELLDHLVARSEGVADRHRLDVSLHHVDLPKLEDEELVERTPGGELVRKGPNWDTARPLLAAISRLEDPT